MILHAINRLGFVTHPFDGLIIQVDAIDADLLGQRGRIDGKPVVLRRNLHPAGLQIFDRLVGPRCPNFSLKVLPPKASPRI